MFKNLKSVSVFHDQKLFGKEPKINSKNVASKDSFKNHLETPIHKVPHCGTAKEPLFFAWITTLRRWGPSSEWGLTIPSAAQPPGLTPHLDHSNPGKLPGGELLPTRGPQSQVTAPARTISPPGPLSTRKTAHQNHYPIWWGVVQWGRVQVRTITMHENLLWTTPHRIKLWSNYCPPGPLSLGQLHTRTILSSPPGPLSTRKTAHQNHYPIWWGVVQWVRVQVSSPCLKTYCGQLPIW